MYFFAFKSSNQIHCYRFYVASGFLFLMLLFVHMQVRYAKVYLRETTLISPFPILLFGGDIEVQHRERLLTVDGWIHFQVCWSDNYLLWFHGLLYYTVDVQAVFMG